MAGNGTKFAKDIVKYMVQSKGFDKVIEKVKVVSAGQGSCVAEMVVGPEHQNNGGTLHGGLTATLVDCISTCALLTHDRGVPGVSVDIHVTYLKAARDGEEIVINANTIKAGKNLAFLEVDIKNKKTGDIIAKGSHTKFIGS